MPVESTYSFRARDSQGEIVTGTMVASNADELSAKLRAEGKFVLAIEDRPMRARAELDEVQLRRNEAAKRVRREDVIAFCQQLSVMLETGVPLSDALDAFCKSMPRREFRTVLDVLCDDIYSGEPFSVAMSRWPRVFPSMMVSLMRASEASGTMATMLGRIGDYLAKERQTAKQIKGALAYPAFMMLASVALTVFLMAFVLPRFAKIYDARSASLPVPTKILLVISDVMTSHYLVYGPIILALTAAVFMWVRRPAGRRCLDWARLNTPLLKIMYRRLYLTRAARTMATLLGGGVGLLDVIDICRGVTNNICYDELWDDMEDRIRNGGQLQDAVMDSDLIPPNLASMIASGEKAGRLPLVMEKIAEFTEQELEAAVKQVTSYIEPAMIFFMGGVVGFVAIALLLPVFNMGKVMSGSG